MNNFTHFIQKISIFHDYCEWTKSCYLRRVNCKSKLFFGMDEIYFLKNIHKIFHTIFEKKVLRKYITFI